MKRYARHCFFLLSALFISISISAANKPWTFLIYMAAANDLNTAALYDLQEMMKIGSNERVNIIVYLTIQDSGMPKRTKKLYIEKGKVHQIGPDLLRDSGDIASLSEALQWACLDYPSDHIVVDLWNHGGGILNRTMLSQKGICYDDDTGHYLTDRDCLDALLWIKDTVRDGKKFDIIVCDACLLASLEMAYTLSSCADYFVASEETIPLGGFQYASLLRLLTVQDIDPLYLVKLMVSLYGKEYLGNSLYTLSAIDLNGIDSVVANLNAVAHILSTQLMGKNGIISKSIIKKCASSHFCPTFSRGTYIDLITFYRNILKQTQSLRLAKSVSQNFRQLLITGIDVLSKVVKAKIASKRYKQQPGGLSIYFSKSSIDPSYYGLYWTEKNPDWIFFLESYLG